MELIDRDVLFNSFNDCSCECGVCQYSLDGLPCGLIENAPTVDAIAREQLIKMIEEIEHYADLGNVGFTRTLIPKDTVLDIVFKYINWEE